MRLRDWLRRLLPERDLESRERRLAEIVARIERIERKVRREQELREGLRRFNERFGRDDTRWL